MRRQVSNVRSRQLREFSRGQLRRHLQDSPTWDDDPLYEDLWREGFVFEGTKIVNPFWSMCGRFEVEPIEEYGMAFLKSKLASRMGYTAPVIDFPAHILKPAVRAAYEKDLLNRVMVRRDSTHCSS